MFAVLRLSTEVTIRDLAGNDVPVKVSGIAGFIPVYETYQEAIDNSDSLKYSVVEVSER